MDIVNRALTLAAITLTASAPPLLTAGAALAGPAPVDDGGPVAKGRLHADGGYDWTLWIALGGAFLVAVLVTAYVAASFRNHRRIARA